MSITTYECDDELIVEWSSDTQPDTFDKVVSKWAEHGYNPLKDQQQYLLILDEHKIVDWCWATSVIEAADIMSRKYKYDPSDRFSITNGSAVLC